MAFIIIGMIACGDDIPKREHTQNRNRSKYRQDTATKKLDTLTTLLNGNKRELHYYTTDGIKFSPFNVEATILGDTLKFNSTNYYISGGNLYTNSNYLNPDVWSYGVEITDDYIKIGNVYWVEALSQGSNIKTKKKRSSASIITPKAKEERVAKSYTVKHGDTFFSISKKTGLSIQTLQDKYISPRVGTVISYN